jgi:hypothetical protein
VDGACFIPSSLPTTGPAASRWRSTRSFQRCHGPCREHRHYFRHITSIHVRFWLSAIPHRGQHSAITPVPIGVITPCSTFSSMRPPAVAVRIELLDDGSVASGFALGQHQAVHNSSPTGDDRLVARPLAVKPATRALQSPLVCSSMLRSMMLRWPHTPHLTYHVEVFGESGRGVHRAGILALISRANVTAPRNTEMRRAERWENMRVYLSRI